MSFDPVLFYGQLLPRPTPPPGGNNIFQLGTAVATQKRTKDMKQTAIRGVGSLTFQGHRVLEYIIL